MRKLKFYKEPDDRWYVDLPEWTGFKAELEMVLGADAMLNYMAEGENEVWVWMSENEFEGADKLEFTTFATEIGNGAYYKMDYYRGIGINLNLWLCDVTTFVFNKFPTTIYISAESK